MVLRLWKSPVPGAGSRHKLPVHSNCPLQPLGDIIAGRRVIGCCLLCGVTWRQVITPGYGQSVWGSLWEVGFQCGCDASCRGCCHVRHGTHQLEYGSYSVWTLHRETVQMLGWKGGHCVHKTASDHQVTLLCGSQNPVRELTRCLTKRRGCDCR